MRYPVLIAKLVGIVIANKVHFTENLNAVCKKANLVTCSKQNLHIFVSRTACTNNLNAYLKSLFSFCSLVSMFCYRRIMYKMSNVYKWSLCLLLMFVIDDQVLLRLFITSLLTRHGYRFSKRSFKNFEKLTFANVDNEEKFRL